MVQENLALSFSFQPGPEIIKLISCSTPFQTNEHDLYPVHIIIIIIISVLEPVFLYQGLGKSFANLTYCLIGQVKLLAFMIKAWEFLNLFITF